MEIKAGTLLFEIPRELLMAGRQHKNAVAFFYCLFNGIAACVGANVGRKGVVILKGMLNPRIASACNSDVAEALIVLKKYVVFRAVQFY